MRSISAVSALAAGVLSVTQLSAQSASIVYRLGADTVAIEQFTRTATKLTGEMVQRSGAAVMRVNYDMTLGTDGRPTAATVTRLNGDGTPVANSATSTRFRFTADSAIREIVFADSVQRRSFPIGKAFVNFPTFVYGPTELLAALKRGWLEQSISRVVDAFLAIPVLIFALMMLAVLGKSNPWPEIFGSFPLNLILILALLDATRVFRLSRAVA